MTTPGASPPLGFLEKVKDTLSRYRLIRRGERVLIGVSGGADSVALLDALCQLRPLLDLHLQVLHVDHQLREDSHEDASFVWQLCAQRDVPFLLERKDVRALSQEQGWSLEDGARRVRYACFKEAALRYSLDVVALAHTADDQAETVLMRILRGTGMAGLGAIPIQRPLETKAQERGEPFIVRPLLEIWRSEVIDYLKARALSFRQDSSNADTYFFRNRIRHELLPLLEQQYNPNIKQRLTQLAAQSREEYAYIRQGVERVWKRVARVLKNGSVLLSVAALRRQPMAMRRHLVRRAIEQVQGDLQRFEFRHWLEVAALLESVPENTEASLPGGIRCLREGENIRCFLNSQGIQQERKS